MTVNADDRINKSSSVFAEVIPEPQPNSAALRSGVQRFMKAAFRAGDEDPLDGPQWLIPGLLYEGQTAVFPGAPGVAKTFAILDLLVRTTLDLKFLGQCVLSGGTILVIGEGQSGIPRRVAALISEYGLTTEAPFLYMKTMPRLLDPGEVRDFIVAVRLLTQHWTVPIRIIAFDTLNRALVGGDEKEGKDIAKLLHADTQIKEAFKCATIYAHHPGKADGNEVRGHSSLFGDTDVTVTVKGAHGTRTVEVKKQKDGEGGATFSYTLKPVHLGLHKRSGEPVTSCLVEWQAAQDKPPMATWSKSLRLIRESMIEALNAGQSHRPRGNGSIVKAVDCLAVRAIHKKLYVNTGDGDRGAAERQAWSMHFKRARNEGLIAGETINNRELIWLASAEDERAAGVQPNGQTQRSRSG